jgi:type II secretion system protein C
MAITSKQAGKLEPPGVAKSLLLFEVKPGSSARQGLAVLGAAEASSRTYVAGALLESGARLTELYADHVVLTRNGQSFTLYLPRKGESDKIASTGVRGLTVGDFPPPAPSIQAPSVRVSDAIRVAPVYEGSQITGYLLYAGAKSGQFDRWGLKPGDVLVSLGGQPVGGAEQMDALLDQLKEGATLAAEVRRGNQRVSVTLDGGALVASARPPPTPPMP